MINNRFTNTAICLQVLLYFFTALNTLAGQANSTGNNSLQQPGRKAKTYALIIGISNYALLPKLYYPARDAYDFYSYLTESSPSADSNTLFLFIDEKATADAIADKMYFIMDHVTAGDSVYIYYSGHGDLEEQTGDEICLLLLSKCEERNYRRQSNYYLDISMFRNLIATCASRQVKTFFVCDACHSGNLVGGTGGQRMVAASLNKEWSNEVKIVSCQQDEFSLEGPQWGGGRGLFSYYLGLGLRGLADANNDKKITLSEMDQYLTKTVVPASKGKQYPLVEGDLKTIITTVKPALYATAQKELKNQGSGSDFAFVSGKGNFSPANRLHDSVLIKIYTSFEKNIKEHRLLDEDKYSAYADYKLFLAKQGDELVANSMRLQLISALQTSFNLLLTYLYNAEYDKFGVLEKNVILKELTLASSLSGTSNYVANQVKTRLLLFQACELTANMNSSSDASNIDKTYESIRLLNQAEKIDSLFPAIHLKLGHDLRFIRKFSDAIKEYLAYQKLLPNDEYSYNALGVAYFDTKQYDLAAAAFKRSLAINPGFSRAAGNLRTALDHRR